MLSNISILPPRPNIGELGDGGAVQGSAEPESIVQDGTRGSATDH